MTKGWPNFADEPFGGEPRHHVGISAGDERHHDGYRPHRPVGRRMRFAGPQGAERERDGQGRWSSTGEGSGAARLCACARKDCSCAKRSEQVMHWSCLNLSMTGFSPPFVCRCRPSCIFQATAGRMNLSALTAHMKTCLHRRRAAHAQEQRAPTQMELGVTEGTMRPSRGSDKFAICSYCTEMGSGARCACLDGFLTVEPGRRLRAIPAVPVTVWGSGVFARGLVC